MKLWEAMLNGAKLGCQVFGKLSDGEGGTCALGAVMVGIGTRPSAFSADLTTMEYPELMAPATVCIACGEPPRAGGELDLTLWGLIVHLNNDHRWSRQRIAEWLANRELKVTPLVKARKTEQVVESPLSTQEVMR